MPEPTLLYAVFHLNLAFSSIDEKSHPAVLKQCYWPLLELIENLEIPLGIELTAYTLECIAKIDRGWIDKFRALLAENRCELIASGDSQIIGPLVPAEVNRQNFALGQQSYQEILNITPELAYVNEQAVSKGLIDVYIEAGFNALVIEWDNPYSHNQDWSREYLYKPQYLLSAKGKKIRVLWNNAIAFQKLQRYAHGENICEDYLAYLESFANEGCAAFSVYGSDAEVFDYRPGRFVVEAEQKNQEWQRISSAFAKLHARPCFEWASPSQVLNKCQDNHILDIATFEHPISVKKQAKYNITRWALSGRNDLLLNQQCFAEYNQLRKKDATAEQWRALCRAWASDLRTHLTDDRYQKINFASAFMHKRDSHPQTKAPLLASEQKAGVDPALFSVVHDAGRNRLKITSEHVGLTLNSFRGLSIDALAFKSHNFRPLCGTLRHGHFDHIRYGADFYSNHLVMERFRERDRVADLNTVSFKYLENDDVLLISCEMQLAFTTLTKWYRVKGEKIECGFDFHQHDRPESSLRLGFITLLDCDTRPWFACHNGGDSLEHFDVKGDVDHGAPVSSIVSATSALGATTGQVQFGSASLGLALKWDQGACAALPMISSKKVNQRYLNRLWFSLIEADETLRPGGYLPSFSFSIAPVVRNASD